MCLPIIGSGELKEIEKMITEILEDPVIPRLFLDNINMKLCDWIDMLDPVSIISLLQLWKGKTEFSVKEPEHISHLREYYKKSTTIQNYYEKWSIVDFCYEQERIKELSEILQLQFNIYYFHALKLSCILNKKPKLEYFREILDEVDMSLLSHQDCKNLNRISTNVNNSLFELVNSLHIDCE